MKLKLVSSIKDCKNPFKDIENSLELQYLGGIDKRISDHKKDASSLIHKYANMSAPVEDKMNMLNETWIQANKLVMVRKTNLEDSLHYHKFLSNC